jgi:hypothetical protein
MPESKFSLCLTALEESGVEFILVGGFGRGVTRCADPDL